MRLLRPFRVVWDFMYPAHLHDLGPDFWNTFFSETMPGLRFELLQSKPSIVELSLKHNLIKSTVAHILKAPWYVLKNRYRMVGGWEVFVQSPTARGSPARRRRA